MINQLSTASVRQPVETAPSTSGSARRVARIVAVLYIIIAFVSGLPHFYMPAELIVPGDAVATASNIAAGEGLFRMAIGAEFVILLSEIVLSVLLYGLFRAVNRTVSLITAVSRLVMTTIHGVNLLNYFVVLLLVRNADYQATLGADGVNGLVSLFVEAHSYGFAIGIAFLVLHVFGLGYLIIKSGYVPKLFGYLFLVAGLGYLIDSIRILLLPGYETTPAWIALPIIIGEIAFPLWLLIKAVNVPAQDVVEAQ